MKDFDRFLIRYRQFGGWRLVGQYARMGVLGAAVKAVVRCIVNGRSLEGAYSVVTRRVDEALERRYRSVLERYADRVKQRETDGEQGYEVPKIIWTAWLQGLDYAPEMVKACVASQWAHFPGYEVRVLDLENYRQWVDLPQEIEDKYRRGRIPPASFSDLLRLAAVRKHGGIWMDATVFCSGFGNEALTARWQRIMRSELTLFRYFRKGETQSIGLSTWFVATVPEQRNVSAVLDMLLAYWRDYDCLVDYYIIHQFMRMSFRRFPEVVGRMPRENSFHSLLLGDALGNDFHEDDWNELVAHVSLHKLNYRKASEVSKNKYGYYWRVVKGKAPVGGT